MLMPEPYRSSHDGYLQSYLTTGERKILSQLERKLNAQKKNGEKFPILLTVNEIIKRGKRVFIGMIREVN